MTLPFRTLNWLFFIITAILELVAVFFLIWMIDTHCVQGGEYGLSVWIYAFILPAIFAQTVILAIFRIFLITAGLDPIAVCFNLISGFFLVLATLILMFAMMWHCQNEFAYRFYISIVFGLLSGILHLVNGLMCLYYMPGEEAHFLKPSSRRLNSMEG